MAGGLPRTPAGAWPPEFPPTNPESQEGNSTGRFSWEMGGYIPCCQVPRDLLFQVECRLIQWPFSLLCTLARHANETNEGVWVYPVGVESVPTGRHLVLGRCSRMLDEQGDGKALPAATAVSSRHLGLPLQESRMQEGGSICPFGKVLFSLSKLGLVYSSQLLHKEDTVPTSQGGKVDLHLGKKCDTCSRTAKLYRFQLQKQGYRVTQTCVLKHVISMDFISCCGSIWKT